MPYAGHTLMEREVAMLAPAVTSADGTSPFLNRKVELVATADAESHLSAGAWHDNPAASRGLAAAAELTDGLRRVLAVEPPPLRELIGAEPWRMEGRSVLDALVDIRRARTVSAADYASRDCGIMQINIPWREVGTAREEQLRTTSSDRDTYMRVALNNLRAAADLYRQAWTGGRRREWQPWVAYTTGWALYPEAWVWSRVTPGTWVATGRYLHKAIRGVANAHWKLGNLSLAGAHAEAERLAGIFGITRGDLLRDETRGVYWRYPPKPTQPGTAADYPKPNDGRSYLSVHSS